MTHATQIFISRCGHATAAHPKTAKSSRKLGSEFDHIPSSVDSVYLGKVIGVARFLTETFINIV